MPSYHDTDPKILPARGKGKAIGVVFRYKNMKAKKALLAGAFILHKGKTPMLKAKRGLWKLTVYLTQGTYRYHFLVDGKKILDPKNQKHDRHASIFSIAKPKR
jgi:1,4-alpha-glucan branching enzyme